MITHLLYSNKLPLMEWWNDHCTDV